MIRYNKTKTQLNNMAAWGLRCRALRDNSALLVSVAAEKNIELFPVANDSERTILESIIEHGNEESIWHMNRYLSVDGDITKSVERLIKVGVLASMGVEKNDRGGGVSRVVEITERWMR